MKACSVLVLVLLCGCVLAARRKPAVALNPDIEKACQMENNLSNADVRYIKTYHFDDLSVPQKQFMDCYVKKTKISSEDGEILVENIPYLTPEINQRCKDKVGSFKTLNHIVAFSLCVTKRRLEICDIVKRME